MNWWKSEKGRKIEGGKLGEKKITFRQKKMDRQRKGSTTQSQCHGVTKKV